MPKQEWIRAALKKKGFKLKDVAAALHVPPPRVTDILNGKREVQADEVEPLADLLSMSARSLLRSLQDGKATIVPGDEGAPRVPVIGQLMGDGTLAPTPKGLKFDSVAPPPDAETSEGLSCFLMGDSSMAGLISEGSFVITADPKVHFVPIAPGGLYVFKLADSRHVLRKYIRDEKGEGWLVAVPGPEFESAIGYEIFRFTMLPDGLAPKGKLLTGDDIIGGVMWVHTRMLEPEDGARIKA
ncbi:helix-turn-helix domain-containing protein [Kordiimonas sp.]|uniref:helix-turn-helix domain-containing protein n=1 Tax=Kordiimonas sp. TaxID=1970157 RepID=UPI003A93DC92